MKSAPLWRIFNKQKNQLPESVFFLSGPKMHCRNDESYNDSLRKLVISLNSLRVHYQSLDVKTAILKHLSVTVGVVCAPKITLVRVSFCKALDDLAYCNLEKFHNSECYSYMHNAITKCFS